MPSPAEPGAQYRKTKSHLLHLNLTALSCVVHMLCRAPPARRGAERKDEDGARLSLSSSQLLLSSLTSWWPKTSTSQQRGSQALQRLQKPQWVQMYLPQLLPTSRVEFTLGFLTGIQTSQQELTYSSFFVTCIYFFFQSVCLIVFFISPVKRMKSSAFRRNALLCTCALSVFYTHTYTQENLALRAQNYECRQTNLCTYMCACPFMCKREKVE